MKCIAKRSEPRRVRHDLASFIDAQIVRHGLLKKADKIWVEIARAAATFNVPLDLAAYRTLHEHTRRCHHIIENPLEYRQRLVEWYTKHPNLRVLSNKEILIKTSWWKKFYER